MFRKKNADAAGQAVLTEGTMDINKRTPVSSVELKEKISPDAIIDEQPNHIEICDGGKMLYVTSLYVDTLPTYVTFAETIHALYTRPSVNVSVFAEPIKEGKVSRMLDKKIQKVEVEEYGAQKEEDSNAVRRLRRTLSKDNQWAGEAEDGEKFFYISILFTIVADTFESMELIRTDLLNKALEKNVVLVSCLGMQAWAYLSQAPFNKLYGGPLSMFGVAPVKKIICDTAATAALLYDHTNMYFFQPDGVYIGHNLMTGEAVTWSPYAKGHRAYSCAFAGLTGVGKSVAIKTTVARLSYDDYYFACIDTDRTGGIGEYVGLCEFLGGINYAMKNGSETKLNIFEVDEHLEVNRNLGVAHRVLRLEDKVADVRNILMTAVIGRKEEPDFGTASFMEKLLSDCTRQIYADFGIIDGDPDSLYEEKDVSEEGMLSDGRVRKMLPTVSDAYLWLAREHSRNSNPHYDLAYQILEDTLSDMVDDLYYDPQSFMRVSPEQARILADSGVKVINIRGSRGYFDGQSSVFVTRDVPFINIDISSLPEGDMLLGQQVAMSFLKEHFIKQNSEDSEHARKIVLIIDEARRFIQYEMSKKFLEDQIATARKNLASIWLSSQNFSDFGDDESIIRNVSTVFIFKQDNGERDVLRKHTRLTESQIDKIVSMGGDHPEEDDDKHHKGEACIIDNNVKVAFLKFDYLAETEGIFAETNVLKRQEQMRRIREGQDN